MEKSMGSENTVFINMTQYGITTLVGATQKKIKWYMKEYATQPDKKFGGGAGKKKLMTYTLQRIQQEDKYFNQSFILPALEQKRWQDFLEDCIIYATLYSFFNKVPVPLSPEVEPGAAVVVDVVHAVLDLPAECTKDIDKATSRPPPASSLSCNTTCNYRPTPLKQIAFRRSH